MKLVPLNADAPSTMCGLRVMRIDVPHAVPACGFLVGDGRAMFAYTGDTVPCADVWSAQGHPISG